jgi:uncharacterized protein (UPF0261 family)
MKREEILFVVLLVSLVGILSVLYPHGVEAAGKRGIPQIIAPSGVNWGSPSKRDYKPEYKLRKKYDYDAARTFIRLSKDEMKMVADTMAGKLNKALGPVKILIPLGGWSSLDRKGTNFYDAELDRTFVDALKKQNKTVLLTTHYMEEAQVLADRVAIINKGRIAAIGPPQELISQYGGLKVLIVRKGDQKLADILQKK